MSIAQEPSLADVLAELAELRALMVAPAAPAGPTFGEFAREWLDRQASTGRLRPMTLKTYAEQLRVHLGPAFGALPLDSITVRLVDEFVAAQAQAGAAARSVNVRVAFLTSVLESAVEYDLITRNPAQGRNRRMRQPTPSRTWISRVDQIEALVMAAEGADRMSRPTGPHKGRSQEARPDRNGPRLRALIATLTFAGLRIGEALALRWEDVDLERGTIDILEAKTAAGVRTIDVLPVLRAELTAYTGWEGAHAGQQDAFVFPTKSGRADSRQYVGKRLRVAVADANRMLAVAGRPSLPKGLSPHSLRRTFASILFGLGESAPYVMAQMGHRTAGLTLAVYARPLDRSDTEALRALVARELPRRVPCPPRPGRSAFPAVRCLPET